MLSEEKEKKKRYAEKNEKRMLKRNWMKYR